MTNMMVEQDGVARPRMSTIRYGTQPAYSVIGRGKYRYNGERWELFMLNVGGVGKVYKRKDGGAFTEITGKTYDITNYAGFVQSMKRVYVFNGVDNLTFIDLTTSTITPYVALTTPGAPTPTSTGMAGTTYTYYYKVSANNDVGTSTASAAGTKAVGKLRPDWVSGTDYMTITWSAVAGATSYNVYVGTRAGYEQLVQTVVGVSWVDNGQTIPDNYTLAPAGNSTAGVVARWLYNDSRQAQLVALDNNNNLFYSAPGTGDFSPYNGGGQVPIDEFGDGELNYVDGFRDGKGNPVLTVGERAAAGKGKMYHATQAQVTFGDQVITYMNVYEANGQYAPYAPRAVVKMKDSLIYPTGDDFKSTGTSQNIVNILTTNSIAQNIIHDIADINLSALKDAVGCEWDNKAMFALPVGQDYNNQIWYMDTARKNLWVLRWTFSGEIKDLWTHEDNTGVTHFCILIDNVILEFTRNVFTEDDGVAFNTRCAYSSLVWDEDGLVMANIRRQYYKFLNPRGTIKIKATGLNKDVQSNTLGSDVFQQRSTLTGWDSLRWDNAVYDQDPGTIRTYTQSIGSQKVKINAKMINQLDWEITTDVKGCDYLLSAVNTQGTTNDKKKLGD